MEFLQRVSTYVPVSGAWRVTPRTWLQRLCWWVLWRDDAAVRRHFDRDETITSIRIEPDQLARKVIEQARLQFDEMAMAISQPTRVLLGRKQFAELMEDPVVAQQMLPRQTIKGTVEGVARQTDPYSPTGFRYYPRFLGLEIEVIPHMDGILVL